MGSFFNYSLGALAGVGLFVGGLFAQKEHHVLDRYNIMSSFPKGEVVSKSEMDTLDDIVDSESVDSDFDTAVGFALDNVRVNQMSSGEGYSLKIIADCQGQEYRVDLVLGRDGKKRDSGTLYFRVGQESPDELATR